MYLEKDERYLDYLQGKGAGAIYKQKTKKDGHKQREKENSRRSRPHQRPKAKCSIKYDQSMYRNIVVKIHFPCMLLVNGGYLDFWVCIRGFRVCCRDLRKRGNKGSYESPQKTNNMNELQSR